MFKTRLISGIVLVLVALLTISGGGLVLFVTLLGVSVIGMDELMRAMNVRTEKFNLLELTSLLMIIGYYLMLYFEQEEYLLPVLLAGLVLNMFVYVFTYPKYHANQIMAAFFSVVYAGVMLSYIYQTRMMEEGVFLVWLIFICSWGCDTCAYCVGMLIGKHKMAPVLSPKKSVEGAVGGVVGAALLGAVYAVAVRTGILEYALICAAGALISMVGDLAASAIKRNQEIKDYGTLIPGHGGIMDRFDSVIFTAPVIYYLAQLLIG
ncbi:phosphatidate cytidylyltransferase [Ruminococcus sp. OA3]|uniref:phosphatidate cytidylyltransferase n=1 Tax=Ruminococcus sp. OA3 TaxID=2914164 RepID=UPI001F05AB24|nr:phosphatidate cytidylyltransferase [Ruminococcus sp. OA3]MCH1983924.1 phosphatidate cytidylyltransferase [Ruminococcus sp. OA3]